MDPLGNVLSAIADPTRRALVDRLARGPARVTDLAQPFDMSLAAVSKHLKVLESAGLVRRERHGREHVLSLDPAPLGEAARWLDHHTRYWTDRLDRLEAFFTPERKPK